MSRVKGPPTQNLRYFRKRLADLPRTVAIEVARRAAPKITELMLKSFDAGQTVYGSARPLGVHGNALSLVASGKTRTWMYFTNDGGSRIRAVLPFRYSKYLIGKYKIMPIGNAAMPAQWRFYLNNLVASVMASAGITVMPARPSRPSRLRRAA